MKISHELQVEGGRKKNPLHFLAFSAAWGRIVVLAVLMSLPMPAYADDDSKLSPDLQEQAAKSSKVTVIVQYSQMPSKADLNALRTHGAKIKSKFQVIRAVTMQVPVSLLTNLANNPHVVYMTPDRTLAITSTSPNEEFATAVQADLAASQYGLTGTGVGIAIIDSGIAAHPDLNNSLGASRVVYSQSFVAGDTTTSDQYGHGTHVAGLVGGTGAGSGTANGYAATYAGMAANVNLINLRVLDQNGAGTDSQVIAAIQQAISLKKTYNIRVINMSLGRPIFESYKLDPVDQAVESAWKAGIVVVVAAGNDGRDNSMGTNGFATIDVPGNDPAAITVGATLTMYTASRVDDEIASYSSKGPTLIDHLVKPDLVAPGNHLVSLRVAGSTLDVAYPELEVTPSNGAIAQYFQLSGTSMSTPIVSGAVALMLQQNSALTPDQVKARLMKTAWKAFGQYTFSQDQNNNIYNNEYDLFTYGAGYLDIDAALGNTNLSSGVALSPTAVYNSSKNIVTIANTSDPAFAGKSVVWGAKTIWATSVVWGSKTILGSSQAWEGTSVVWGAKSMSGFSVVWGATDWKSGSMGSYSSTVLGDQ